MDLQRLLSVLPAGQTPLNPSDLLASRSASTVFDELRRRYDYVIIDAPPVLPVSDVAALTKHVDGVLFLTNDEISRRGPVRRAARLLTQIDAPVIGAVVNAAPIRHREAHNYYDLGGYYPSSIGDRGDRTTPPPCPKLNGNGAGADRRDVGDRT